MNFSDLLPSVIGGGASGTVVALIAYFCYLKISKIEEQRAEDSAKQIDELSNKLNFFERERFARIEKALEKHLDEDSPATVNLQFKTILGAIEKIDNKVERMSEINIRNAQELENHALYLRNIDRSQKDHVRTYHKG